MSADPGAQEHEANGNVMDPIDDHVLLRGIAAKVGRIDDDVERLLDMRREDRELLRQIAEDVRTYRDSMAKVENLAIEAFQKALAQKP